jgi:hypothetical protein
MIDCMGTAYAPVAHRPRCSRQARSRPGARLHDSGVGTSWPEAAPFEWTPEHSSSRAGKDVEVGRQSLYTEEFRKDAVALYRAADGKRTYAAVAADVGVSGETLRTWVRRP